MNEHNILPTTTTPRPARPRTGADHPCDLHRQRIPHLLEKQDIRWKIGVIRADEWIDILAFEQIAMRKAGDPSFGGQHGINVYRNLISQIVFEHLGVEHEPITVLVGKALFQIHPATGIEFYRVDDELACIIDKMAI